MFQKAKQIEKSFQSIRSFTIATIIGSLLLCCFCIYKAFNLAAITQNKIYVLANGKALEAIAGEKKDNIPVECRDHVRTFHQLFFSLDPDNLVIQSNISRALYLADASAQKQYENLKENGYYNNIISGNVSQEVQTDSVTVDINQYPYSFRYYGRLKIIRPTSISYRTLITSGFLRNVSRSDNNSHGYLLERWETIENRDIKTENR